MKNLKKYVNNKMYNKKRFKTSFSFEWIREHLCYPPYSFIVIIQTKKLHDSLQYDDALRFKDSWSKV